MLVAVVPWSRCLLGVVVLRRSHALERLRPFPTSPPVPGAGLPQAAALHPGSALELINSADGDRRILLYRIVVKIKMANRTREFRRKLDTKCYLSISCYYCLILSDPCKVAITVSVLLAQEREARWSCMACPGSHSEQGVRAVLGATCLNPAAPAGRFLWRGKWVWEVMSKTRQLCDSTKCSLAVT